MFRSTVKRMLPKLQISQKFTNYSKNDIFFCALPYIFVSIPVVGGIIGYKMTDEKTPKAKFNGVTNGMMVGPLLIFLSPLLLIAVPIYSICYIGCLIENKK